MGRVRATNVRLNRFITSLPPYISRSKSASGPLSFVLVSAIVISIFLLWPSPSSRANDQLNHITEITTKMQLLNGSWINLPGAFTGASGVRINPVPFKIVQQDGTGGQDNYPVNLYGAHLKVDGDLTIKASLKELANKATMSLYGQPPIIYDEFRYERSSLHLNFNGNRLSVHAIKNNETLFNQSYTLAGDNQSHQLEIILKANQITVIVDGAALGGLPENELFGSGEVWFGMSAETTSWLLASLVAEKIGASKLEIIDTQSLSASTPEHEGLQYLANQKRPDFLIGSAVALSPLVSDPAYARIALSGNFGSFTTENALKWQFVHPTPSVYDFTEIDALLNLASRHNIAIHGHPLVFGEANPRWVQNLPTDTAQAKQMVEAIMLEHIATVTRRYVDKINSWDVVNEPLADYEHFEAGHKELRNHIWYKAMGETYIAKAFRAAHAAAPTAKLFINEYGLEEDGERWNAMLALLKRLKDQDVPIHGVGFQAHVYERGDRIDPEVLKEHMQQLAELGLEARISEIDVYSGDGQSAQANQYASVLNACLETPNCTSYTTWGVSDKYNMYQDEGNLLFGQDFLWDKDMHPTPAIGALRDMLTR